MDRRAAGFGLLALAAVALLVATSLTGRGEPGRAVAAPIPGPPIVGDCVLDPLDRTPPTNIAQQDLRIEPCTGERFGEVVRVVEHDDSVGRATAGGDFGDSDFGGGDSGGGDYGTDPWDPAECDLWSEDPLGLLATIDETGLWHPELNYQLMSVYPTRLQTASGQRWAACVITPLTFTTDSAYAGTIVGPVGTGLQPAAYAVCMNRFDPMVFDIVDCETYHRGEVLASWANGPGEISQDRLDATCRVVAATLTRMPDVTAGGLLSVEAEMFRIDQASGGLNRDHDPVDSRAGLAGWCTITALGDARLTSSLIGIGTNPLPLDG